MTAWAPWSWTSGPTSPSSLTRPASGSEQPAHAEDAPTLPSPLGGFFPTLYFAFLVCVPTPTSSPAFQFFRPLRDAPQRPLRSLLPASHLCLDSHLGDSISRPGPGCWAAAEIQVLNHTSPSEGRSMAPTRGPASGPGVAPVAASVLLLPDEDCLLVRRDTRQTVVLPSRPRGLGLPGPAECPGAGPTPYPLSSHGGRKAIIPRDGQGPWGAAGLGVRAAPW